MLTGNIHIEFIDVSNDEVEVTLKSNNSVLNSGLSGVDESYIINLKEGYIE